VVLPVPGGATRTAAPGVSRAATTSGRNAATGRSVWGRDIGATTPQCDRRTAVVVARGRRGVDYADGRGVEPVEGEWIMGYLFAIIFTVAGFVPLIVGVVAVRAALARAERERRVVALGHQTNATVVDNRSGRDSDGDRVYTPVIELWTSTEQLVRTDLGTRSRELPVGTAMNVFYDPDDPSFVVRDRPMSPVPGVVFGGFFIVFGCVWLGIVLGMGVGLG
jgi:hypothetical protein